MLTNDEFNDEKLDKFLVNVKGTDAFSMITRCKSIDKLRIEIQDPKNSRLVYCDPDNRVALGFILFEKQDFHKVNTLFTFGKNTKIFPDRMKIALEEFVATEPSKTQGICGCGEPRPPRICYKCEKRFSVDTSVHYCLRCGSCPVCDRFYNSPDTCVDC